MRVTRRDMLGAGVSGSLLAASSRLAGPALAHDGHHAQSHEAIPSASPRPASAEAYARFTAEMHTGMENMMRDMHAEPPSGDPDIDFLAMMIPHHAGAVEMARLVLKDGRDPLVREIAEKIMAAQLSEIDGMLGRLAELLGGRPPFPALTGNRGQ